MISSSTPPLPPQQVQVGSTPQDQRIVGYISCTHLHALPGRIWWPVLSMGRAICLLCAGTGAGAGSDGSSTTWPLCFCPTEDSAIRCEQLDLLQDWLADFRKSTSSSSTANPEELVAFDVICGDLNFDNCSSGEVVVLPTRGLGSSHNWKGLGYAAGRASCSS